MKRCTGCQEFKSLECFSRRSRYKGGLQSRCKACRRIAYLANKTREDARAKTYNYIHKEQRANYNKQFAASSWGKYTRCKARAKAKHLSFTLNCDQFSDLITAECTYCFSSGGGIDRIDSSLGYELFNCLPCCFQCNSMKLDFSLEEFLSHVRKICVLHT